MQVFISIIFRIVCVCVCVYVIVYSFPLENKIMEEIILFSNFLINLGPDKTAKQIWFLFSCYFMPVIFHVDLFWHDNA